MLHEQFDLLLESLNARNTDIAKFSDVSISKISRLRSGADHPAPDSQTLRQVMRGIFRMAEQTGQTQKIYNLIGLQGAAQPLDALREWLFSETTSDRSMASRIVIFRRRFDALLSLSGMTLKSVSQAAGTDYSYVYRMHKGERFPRPRSVAVVRLCDALLREIRTQGKQQELTALTEIPAELCSADTLRDWLFGTVAYDDSNAVRQLLSLLERVDPGQIPPLPPPPVCKEIAPVYSGNAGLQQAVIRFLNDVQPGQTLRLYSDHPMEWMGGAFRLQWASLMVRCLRAGVRIRIIHNVDRNIPEMLAAIRNWMPLYLTGLIEPYYSTSPLGERFRHTLFLCPGQAAVTGCSPAHSVCTFRYVQEAQELAALEQQYDAMLRESLPLLTIHRTRQTLGDDALHRRFGKTEILVDAHCAIVNKCSEPPLSFRLMHPALVGVLRMMAERS